MNAGAASAPRDGLYLGLISGTSIDAVDAALVEIRGGQPRLCRALGHPIPGPLASALHRVDAQTPLDTLLDLDQQVARLHAEAARRLLSEAKTGAAEVIAIGSHGQTVYHRPHGPYPTTVQLGDPSRLAAETGITTVADFRRRDMALGGQGAPLVPAFHAACLRQAGEDRAVLNLGGIANLTLLPGTDTAPVTGFDTGPANTLLDAWFRQHRDGTYDRDGAWAAGGALHTGLLRRLLNDDYLKRPPPKSTGPEYFSPDWLHRQLDALPGAPPAPQDVQRTLLAFTAQSAVAALAEALPGVRQLYICGGGIHNTALWRALAAALASRCPGCQLTPTTEAGLDPDWLEAMAFAWLAYRTLAGLPGNLPEVTGARQAAPLGGIFPAG
ncbi:anhydro-N-acetylmuramic acid kinase [Alkalilimnicola ehrlichii MLHE-1]|uniref:Anhydro-N-acetylmuramic acid kinase n=1 Tax=Alkalilimnicola ehrlichii (strain ATCC BAA-1101 / DSM 17681 / MLHE-1) TaxID=187272 RepID=Q0ABJ7_ALKEH|nr:anhydro-N-acetylmuramic acid kinase [Alkalilimnicola ehrlichii]ABI55790.1 protein of unknown function UPF0075 [Alkalilimnicola ehrlichii MLHE-1]